MMPGRQIIWIVCLLWGLPGVLWGQLPLSHPEASVRLHDYLEWHPSAQTLSALVHAPDKEFIPFSQTDTLSGKHWFRLQLDLPAAGPQELQLRHETSHLVQVYQRTDFGLRKLPVFTAFGGFISPLSVPPEITWLELFVEIEPIYSACTYDCFYLETRKAYQEKDYFFGRTSALLSGMVLLIFLTLGIWGSLQRKYKVFSLLTALLGGLLLIWLYGGFLWEVSELGNPLISALLLLHGAGWLLFWSDDLLPIRKTLARRLLGLLLIPLAGLLFPHFLLLLSTLPLLVWAVLGLLSLIRNRTPWLLAAQVVYLLMVCALMLWLTSIFAHWNPFTSLVWPLLFAVQSLLSAVHFFQNLSPVRSRKEERVQRALQQARLDGLKLRIQEQDKVLQDTQEKLTQQERQLVRYKDDLRMRNELLEEKDRYFKQVSDMLQEQKEELELQNEEVMMKSSLIQAQKDLAAQTYRQIKVLKDIGQQLNSSLELEEIVNIAYENICSFAEVEGFSIGIYNLRRHDIWMMDQRWKGEHKETARRYSLHREFRLLDFAIRDRRELLIGTFDKDYKKYLDQEPPPTEDGHPQSVMYIPLIARQNVIGALILEHTKENAFTYEQLDMLKSIGQFLAISLDNAMAYQKIQDINEQVNKQNYQIMSSLRYAQTVQEAILPQDGFLEELFSEHFVIFMPRDLVSGDFYWITESGGYIFLAVVDCTGHGVPGAFMSMVGHSLLNQIINEQQIYSTAKILTELDRGVKHLLQQKQGQNTDGMDLSLCRIKKDGKDEDQHVITFSGAKSNIFYTSKGKVEMLRGDRLSIGGTRKQKGEFTEEAFILEKGEQLYLATDGYMDQHDENKRKIGRLRFHDLLREIQYLPLNIQHYRLGEYLADHKKGQEQRDDITVMGIRI